MKILSKDLIDEFITDHADAKSALQRWVDIVEDAEWHSHADLKSYFPSADYVGNERYVFNIKGNKYRMVVVVIFVAGVIIIRFLGTHAAYDRIKSKTI
ncbi:mRNA interferase HigB [Parabacteroides sp. PF5-5]|uniref:type II toxin-antitoxin system HigB family toxin n=1 Tax=unclassified Parabacteroides TaxID=2649774 RepID=UPI002476902B|nr:MULTISPECIES: type II toxin-antitoxin system HigB family toxin [unclassified Parabacteroides]MDH6303893.1 mRNA interferase HigB [Parabacteroides sp. PH5-39]MDH6314510.1 mRNA interferase HigB [Parabacteroides sp. PF5-13]MDH6318425.1 mRNA interferase HigB [Parabacteroides sp. PH5-13]MDH6322282.1 mRNA interferase HigB [Parabacteroides sp. PH5-8]MDH6325638.1 mRNA interferase HigB [Parabacteroides sp. PH5-41]